MRVDVRARILWGDSEESIRAVWLKKGALIPDVDAAIQEAFRERLRHFRKRGFQDVLIALGCFALGGGAAWIHYAVYHYGVAFTAKGMALVWIAMVGLPAAGLHFLWRGVRRLTSGGDKEESASDLAEFDFLSKD